MITLAVSSFGIMMLLGLALGWYRSWGKIGLAVGVLVAVFVYCLLVPKTGEGFADLSYVIVAYLVCLPGIAGVFSGGILGTVIRRARQSQ